jgi:hypothetical protein
VKICFSCRIAWLVLLSFSLSVAGGQNNPNWMDLLGPDPVFATNMKKYLKSETNVTLPDPAQYPERRAGPARVASQDHLDIRELASQFLDA